MLLPIANNANKTQIIQIDPGSYSANSLVAWFKPTPHTNDGVLRTGLPTKAESLHLLRTSFGSPSGHLRVIFANLRTRYEGGTKETRRKSEPFCQTRPRADRKPQLFHKYPCIQPIPIHVGNFINFSFLKNGNNTLYFPSCS